MVKDKQISEEEMQTMQEILDDLKTVDASVSAEQNYDVINTMDLSMLKNQLGDLECKLTSVDTYKKVASLKGIIAAIDCMFKKCFEFQGAKVLLQQNYKDIMFFLVVLVDVFEKETCENAVVRVIQNASYRVGSPSEGISQDFCEVSLDSTVGSQKRKAANGEILPPTNMSNTQEISSDDLIHFSDSNDGRAEVSLGVPRKKLKALKLDIGCPPEEAKTEENNHGGIIPIANETKERVLATFSKALQEALELKNKRLMDLSECLRRFGDLKQKFLNCNNRLLLCEKEKNYYAKLSSNATLEMEMLWKTLECMHNDLRPFHSSVDSESDGICLAKAFEGYNIESFATELCKLSDLWQKIVAAKEALISKLKENASSQQAIVTTLESHNLTLDKLIQQKQQQINEFKMCEIRMDDVIDANKKLQELSSADRDKIHQLEDEIKIFHQNRQEKEREISCLQSDLHALRSSLEKEKQSAIDVHCSELAKIMSDQKLVVTETNEAISSTVNRVEEFLTTTCKENLESLCRLQVVNDEKINSIEPLLKEIRESMTSSNGAMENIFSNIQVLKETAAKSEDAHSRLEEESKFCAKLDSSLKKEMTNQLECVKELAVQFHNQKREKEKVDSSLSRIEDWLNLNASETRESKFLEMKQDISEMFNSFQSAIGAKLSSSADNTSKILNCLEALNLSEFSKILQGSLQPISLMIKSNQEIHEKRSQENLEVINCVHKLLVKKDSEDVKPVIELNKTFQSENESLKVERDLLRKDFYALEGKHKLLQISLNKLENERTENELNLLTKVKSMAMEVDEKQQKLNEVSSECMKSIKRAKQAEELVERLTSRLRIKQREYLALKNQHLLEGDGMAPTGDESNVALSNHSNAVDSKNGSMNIRYRNSITTDESLVILQQENTRSKRQRRLPNPDSFFKENESQEATPKKSFEFAKPASTRILRSNSNRELKDSSELNVNSTLTAKDKTGSSETQDCQVQ